MCTAERDVAEGRGHTAGCDVVPLCRCDLCPQGKDNSDAFFALAGYIGVLSAPKNKSVTSQKAEAIAMTAPVIMQDVSEKIAMTAPVIMSESDKKEETGAWKNALIVTDITESTEQRVL